MFPLEVLSVGMAWKLLESIPSCIRWLKNNRSVIQAYYSYMDVEKEKENEVQ